MALYTELWQGGGCVISGEWSVTHSSWWVPGTFQAQEAAEELDRLFAQEMLTRLTTGLSEEDRPGYAWEILLFEALAAGVSREKLILRLECGVSTFRRWLTGHSRPAKFYREHAGSIIRVMIAKARGE